MEKNQTQEENKRRELRTLSDPEIIEQVILGDTEAFAALFDRYSPKIFGYLWHIIGRRDECEDYLQETFYKAYVNLRYCRERDKFSSWLFSIAHNVAISGAKRLRTLYTREISEGDPAMLEALSSTGEDTLMLNFIRQETFKNLKTIVDRIPQPYKETIVLFYYNELSVSEVAEILNLPINTVKTRMYRGRKYIADRIRERENLEIQKINTGKLDTSRASFVQ